LAASLGAGRGAHLEWDLAKALAKIVLDRAKGRFTRLIGKYFGTET